ncbi:MAG: ATP-binding cassette domain-containing protein, partial [Xanthobacteraceae bacterium]
MSENPALTAHAVSKRFGGLVAVNDISFALAENEVLGLIGPNGSGKTTLLRAIAGLAARPGVTVRLRAVVGYLPQRLDILDDSLSV